MVCDYAIEVRALEAEVERLRKALGRATVYVEHLPLCCAQKVPTTCDCGYCEMVVMAEAALAGEGK